MDKVKANIFHFGVDDNKLIEGKRKAKFKFVIATDKELMPWANSAPFYRSLSMMKLDYVVVDVDVWSENKEGLGSIYNNYIDNKNVRDGFDFICFVHDDIWINDVLFFDKIISAANNTDIIGACGGKSWEIGDNDINEPLIWTRASKRFGGSGFMLHGADCSQNLIPHSMNFERRSFFSTNYGNSPALTTVIDGSFICFTKNAFDSGIRFDEEFKFHWYDIDICFQALVKKLRVGTAPILITHESLGMSVAQPEFMESQKKFLDKWFKKQES